MIEHVDLEEKFRRSENIEVGKSGKSDIGLNGSRAIVGAKRLAG